MGGAKERKGGEIIKKRRVRGGGGGVVDWRHFMKCSLGSNQGSMLVFSWGGSRLDANGEKNQIDKAYIPAK